MDSLWELLPKAIGIASELLFQNLALVNSNYRSINLDFYDAPE
jgi:hypothetical protein